MSYDIDALLAKGENVAVARTFRGYDPGEVEKLLRDFCGALRALREENEALRREIAERRSEEQALSAALLKAERLAAATRSEAEREAQSLRSRALAEADQIRAAAEAEAAKIVRAAQEYRRRVHERCYAYEREARVMLEEFGAAAKKHAEALERELLASVQDLLRRVDEEIAALPRPLPEASEADEGARQAEPPLEDGRLALLAGRVLMADVHGPDGRVVAPRGSVVTPKLVRELAEKNLEAELAFALEREAGEEVDCA